MSKISANAFNFVFCDNSLHFYANYNRPELCSVIDFKNNACENFSNNNELVVDSVAFSSDGDNVVFCVQKQMFLYKILAKDMQFIHCAPIEKAALCVKFFNKSKMILVAERSGIVAFYSYESGLLEKQATCLGHNSMITDAIITPCDRFVITADRDEKIRVSHYPNTYNIQSFCLDHKQFVSSLILLPSDENILVSTSGDGSIRLWDYQSGKQLAIYNDCRQEALMKCVYVQSENVIAVQKHKSPEISLVSVVSSSSNIRLELNRVIETFSQVIDICVLGDTLLYLLNGEKSVHADSKMSASHAVLQLFVNKVNADLSAVTKHSPNQVFDILFKKEFNNVELYHERKRARLAEKRK